MSTLTLAYPDLQREVAMFLGYGRESANWTADESETIASCIASGTRQFYFPTPLAGEKTVHEWSFLSPTGDLYTVAGDYDYDLPANFDGLNGPLCFSVGSSKTIKLVDVSAWQDMRGDGSFSGYPMFAAIRPKIGTGVAEPTQELLLYPTPDAEYRIYYQYRCLLPDALTANYPYPLGNASHAETLLESCLSAAEIKMNDEAGIHTSRYMALLMSSVLRDRQVSGGDWLGYNGDKSDGYEGNYRERETVLTYNGNPV